MNYRNILLPSLSQISIRDLAFQIVSENPADFAQILRLCFDGEQRVAWHSAWLLEKISETAPEFFGEKELVQIVKLATKTAFTGVQRSLLSVLLNIGLPDNLPVAFINLSFERMLSPKSPVAVQVLSMKVLHKFAQKEPDFMTELQVCLQNADEADYSAGWRAAKRKVVSHKS